MCVQTGKGHRDSWLKLSLDPAFTSAVGMCAHAHKPCLSTQAACLLAVLPVTKLDVRGTLAQECNVIIWITSGIHSYWVTLKPTGSDRNVQESGSY